MRWNPQYTLCLWACNQLVKRVKAVLWSTTMAPLYSGLLACYELGSCFCLAIKLSSFFWFGDCCFHCCHQIVPLFGGWLCSCRWMIGIPNQFKTYTQFFLSHRPVILGHGLFAGKSKFTNLNQLQSTDQLQPISRTSIKNTNFNVIQPTSTNSNPLQPISIHFLLF